MNNQSFLFLLFLVLLNCYSGKAELKVQSYTWKNVQIVGGGFVDGIIFHPSEPNLRYCRTDMGGAYRWEESLKRWIPLLDWVSYEDNNLMGVESIAIDPNNPDRLYLSCGTYTAPHIPNGAVLRSFDRGLTFERIDMPFKMGGNENGRGNGERMMVDPRNSNIIYLGTRNDGLWRSDNAAKNWKRVASFPDITETIPQDVQNDPGRRNRFNRGCGIVFVVFGSSSPEAQNTQEIFVGVSLMDRENLFHSTDGGKSWSAVPGQPVQYRPTHGILATDGNLYISYGTNPGPMPMSDGGVWKLNTQNGEWTDITPEKPDQQNNLRYGYAAVAVDAQNPATIIASAFGRPGRLGGDEIFRTTDGGKTWKAVFANGTEFDYSKAPYVQRTHIHWMFDIEINPLNPNHAIFTTGFGGFETFNLGNADKNQKTNWSVYTTGIEETVPLELLSPPQGAHLLTGIGDYGGFAHWDLDSPSPDGSFDNPHLGNTDGVSCAWLKPEMVLRVGVSSGNRDGDNIGISTDFAKTWKPVKKPTAQSRHGHIAVSAHGETWIWTPERHKPYFTIDAGENWTLIETLPENTRVVADKANPLKFYAINLADGILYTSTDGAKSFSTSLLNLIKGKVAPGSFRGDMRGGQDRIYTTPGYENDLWIAAYDGLYHSPEASQPFELLPGVSEIHGFGFGKEAPASHYPALFLIGIVNGVRGIFRSDDQARNWVRINDDQHQWGLLLHITGDPKKYGRAYVGTHGRGALYGDIK
jgi:hypothetical protein